MGSEKERLLLYIRNYDVGAKNDDWHNEYYCIMKTFDLYEIKRMSEKEVNNLLELARSMGSLLP